MRLKNDSRNKKVKMKKRIYRRARSACAREWTTPIVCSSDGRFVALDSLAWDSRSEQFTSSPASPPPHFESPSHRNKKKPEEGIKREKSVDVKAE